MSKSKRGGGANEIYQAHLFGSTGFKYNPAIAREAAITRLLERNMTELAVNRFKWTGLPASIDPRFLEMCLFFNALAVVYWDKDYDKLLAVRGTGTGFVNMLDNPVSFTVIGPGSLIKPTTDTAPAQFQNKIISAYSPAAHMDLDDEEKRLKAIPIWANYLRSPEIDIVKIYATRLATIDRTLEINSKNSRRNKVIKGSPNMQLSMVNFARGIDQGDELMQVTGPMQDMEFIEALDLGVDAESFDKLSLLRTRIWNEAMTLLGIDAANQDKKERLVVAEVGANDGQTDSMRFVSLNARRQACDMINEVFSGDLEEEVTVDFMVEVEADIQADKQAKRQLETQNALNTDEEYSEETDSGDARLKAVK
jgi:hypothetical protein